MFFPLLNKIMWYTNTRTPAVVGKWVECPNVCRTRIRQQVSRMVKNENNQNAKVNQLILYLIVTHRLKILCYTIKNVDLTTVTTNVPSKSLLNVRGMKGRVSSGGYSNLGTRGKEILVFSPKIKVFSKKKKRSSPRIDLSISQFLSRLFEVSCYFRGEYLFFFREHLDFARKIGKSEMIQK